MLYPAVCRNYTFHDAHVKIAQMVAEATSAAGITNFVHVSALNADPDSPSLFLKSKVGWIHHNIICVHQFLLV